MKPEQTHLETARFKREALSRWLRSKDVSEFDSLAIITEEVKFFFVDRVK